MIDSWRRTVILVPGKDMEALQHVRTWLSLRGVAYVEAFVSSGETHPRLTISGVYYDGLDEIQRGVSINGL